MALESLFKDRSIRKEIRDTVLEATEIGSGRCSSCGSRNSLIHVYGRNLCESCCNMIMSATEDYDRVYESSVSDEDVGRMLGEGYVIPADLNKLMSDAQSKFNGSVPDLMKSYGMSPHKDWDDRISKGKIYIKDTDIKGGKCKVNKFLIDYDCSFDNASAASKLVPDKDGTTAPTKVNGKAIVPSNGSQPAKVGNVSTQSSSHLVQKGIQAGPGIKAVSSGKDTFDVQLTQGLKLNCTLKGMSNGQQGVEAAFDKYPNYKMTYYVKGTTNDELAKNLVEMIKQAPDSILQAFESDDMDKDGFVINKYPAYSFVFDEKSFDGKNVSLALALNGKKYERSRAYLTDRALFNRAQLSNELLKYMDASMSRFYPMLFNGTANIKTSIGKATTDLISVEKSDKYAMGEVKLTTELGNVSIPWSADGERFKDKEITHNTVCDIIFSALPKIIPGWDDPKYKGKLTLGTQSFEISDLDDNGMKYSVAAYFDLNDLYDSGSIILNMSVIDDHTGEEQPKEMQKVVYRQAGVNIKDFLERESRKIHAHYFKKSNMVSTLTQSARDKVGNPTKKAALLTKVSSSLLQALKVSNSAKFNDVELEIENFDVNAEGKVTEVSFRIYDFDYANAESSDDLEKFLSLDKITKMVKKGEPDNSSRGYSEYGPSVVYTVTDIDKFSDITNLSILESLIFEAFGIVTINENGRKQIFA